MQNGGLLTCPDDLAFVLKKSPIFLEEIVKIAQIPRHPQQAYGWYEPTKSAIQMCQCIVQAVSTDIRKGVKTKVRFLPLHQVFCILPCLPFDILSCCVGCLRRYQQIIVALTLNLLRWRRKEKLSNFKLQCSETLQHLHMPHLLCMSMHRLCAQTYRRESRRRRIFSPAYIVAHIAMCPHATFSAVLSFVQCCNSNPL